jgi:recombination protein RecT
MTRSLSKPVPPPPSTVKAPVASPNPRNQALETIKKWIGAKESTFATLLGSPEAAKRFGQVLLLACLRNPALLTCDLKSLFLAALYCAQRGLEPGVQDGCALVPYKGKVTPIPQYRALVKQAMETGSVKSAKAILIHANDTVEWEEGMTPRFVHRPTPLGQDRGPVVGAYSRIVLPDGTVEIEPMDLQEIYKRRDASAAWRDSHNRGATPWGQWENEMIKKTALKNGLRTIPVARKLRDLLESDSRLEGGAPVEAVMDLDNEVLDVSVVEAQQDKPQTKADALADMLMGETPAAQSEPEPEQAIPSTPEPEQADPPQTQPTETPEEQATAPTSPDLEALKHRIKEIYAVAVQKQIVGLVLQQFKMDKWDDFLAFPEILPTLEQFVEQAAPAQPEKPKRR